MKIRCYTIILVSILILLTACAPLPTPVSQSNPPSSNNSSPANSDWQQFLTVDLWVSCIDRVLPIAIDASSGNPEDQIASTNATLADVREEWAVVPDNLSEMLFTLTNIANSDWIEINKSLNVSVSTNASVPKHVDVVRVGGCGGAQQIRDFPTINLRSDLKNFTQKSTFAGADFFTLQPGEFEKFNTHFKCEAPGYYTVSINVEYSYQGENGIIEFPEFDVLCPQSFTVYIVDGGELFGVEKLNWKNGEYFPTP